MFAICFLLLLYIDHYETSAINILFVRNNTNSSVRSNVFVLYIILKVIYNLLYIIIWQTFEWTRFFIINISELKNEYITDHYCRDGSVRLKLTWFALLFFRECKLSFCKFFHAQKSLPGKRFSTVIFVTGNVTIS